MYCNRQQQEGGYCQYINDYLTLLVQKGRRQEAGGRRQEAGGRRQKSGGRKRFR
ncbi:MAG: hypothetical protein F6K41_16220 [Symploca sp. SIO3E6]|nr:hypothetical protein [Caldora sp. SIO3E6]